MMINNSFVWLQSMSSRVIVLVLIMFIASCSITPTSRYQHRNDSAPSVRMDPDQIEDAIPTVEPQSKWGNSSSYEVRGVRYRVLPDNIGYTAKGKASWYGSKFHGHTTSNGEIYDMYEMSAAHKTLPIPTYLSVTNVRNGRQVIVRVNDRGPFHEDRIIDLSYAAALKLGFVKHGVAQVKLEAIDPVAWNEQQNQIANNGNDTSIEEDAELNLQQAVEQNLQEDADDIYIQVAAFSQLSSAKQLKERLQIQTDWSVVIFHDAQKKPNLHKVQIGPLDNLETAQQLQEKLNSDGHGKPIIIALPKI
jgi:rare lipoprotein A